MAHTLAPTGSLWLTIASILVYQYNPCSARSVAAMLTLFISSPSGHCQCHGQVIDNVIFDVIVNVIISVIVNVNMSKLQLLFERKIFADIGCQETMTTISHTFANFAHCLFGQLLFAVHGPRSFFCDCPFKGQLD